MIAYLIGGHQGRPAGTADRDHRRLYDAGVVLALDTMDQSVRPVARWAENDRPIGHAFKGGCVTHGRIVACTERTVCWIDPTTGAVERTHSDPAYNDLHGVTVEGQTLWAVSTGAEGVVQTDLTSGERSFLTADGPAAAPQDDLRPLNLRPHTTHPNHLCHAPDGPWLTRLHPRDLVSLKPPHRSLSLGGERIHDGVWWRDRLWCTEVDGHLVSVDPRTGQTRRMDLSTHQRPRPSGWCRGLALSPSLTLVGFTRLRSTRWRSHLAWVRGALRGRQDRTSHPTRVQAHHPAQGHALWEVDLEPHGLHALFAIVWADDPLEAQ